MIPWSTSVAVRNTPFLTWALIAVSALVFLFELSLPQRALQAFLTQYGVVPARFAHPQSAAEHGLAPWNYLPFLTSMFLHGGWGHILINMWTLAIFGPAIEDRLGPMRFLGFYLVCGIGASIAHAVVNADSTVPSLGASGAIAGVMGAYMRLFPMSRVIVLVPIIFIPFFFEFYAFLYVGFWMALQLLQGFTDLMSERSLGGIAWWAHVGGFLVGFLMIGALALKGYRSPQRDEGKSGFSPDGRRRRSRKGPWG